MPSFAGISFTPLSSLPSGGSILENEVFLTGSAAISQASNVDFQLTFSLTAQGNFTTSGGTPYFNSLTVGASGVVTLVEGSVYSRTITIDGNSTLTPLIGNILGALITVAGISAADVAGVVFSDVAITIAGSSAITQLSSVAFFPTLLIGANANFFSPGGLVQFANRAIEGFSTVNSLSGLGYFETRTIDGNSSIAQTEFYVKNGILTIAGTADIAGVAGFSPGAVLTIAGMSALNRANIVDFQNSLSISGNSKIFIENLYEFLYIVNANAATTVTLLYTPGTLQNPTSVGNVSVTANAIFNRTVIQTLTINQIRLVKKPTQFVTQTYNLTQAITKQKIVPRTITQTLSYTQTQTAARRVTNNLTLNQTIVVRKIISQTITQTWSVNQSISNNNVVNRIITQTLVYNPVNVQNVPIIGANNNSPTHIFSYTVPNIHVVLVPKKCAIILGTPRRIIVLPCPRFGDSQAPQHEINLKRTMTGDTFTYVKRTKAQKLKYSFELWTNKYLELRQFYIDFSSEVMTLQNHHAETWLVNIVNNPLEFAAEERSMNRGERYTVTMEFEGVKIL